MSNLGKELGREIAKLKREISDLKAALRRRSLGSSSIDNAYLVVRDSAGTNRTEIGGPDGHVDSNSVTAQSEDYDPSTAQSKRSGWIVNKKGNAEFNDVTFRGTASGTSASYGNLTANDSLIYLGDELSEVIGGKPKGLVGRGDMAAGTYSTTTEVAILEFSASVEEGRAYRLALESSRVTGPTGERANVSVFYTWDGTQPYPGGGKTFMWEGELRDTGLLSVNGAILFYPPSSGTARFCLVLYSIFGGEVVLRYDRPHMWLEDVGAPVQNTGVDRYAGTASPKEKKSFNIPCYLSRSYQGDGDLFNENDSMYQGKTDYAPENGYMSSLAWFDEATIDDLIGVPDSDINYVQVYLYYDHWHYNDGGTAVVGMFHHDGSQYPDQLQAAFNRDQGKWLNASAGMINAMQNGDFHGVMLGPAAAYSPNEEYYGYARGATQNLACGVRAEYYK
jgi:hypothetical protein